ncbi:type VI secretion system baseplate subunit TssE [Aquicoccus sp. G2-2]|uniref:type VI secretion system baseplate subunit TssE n=1 Tax=Aquicoccus sp. G2-2 TaxID=3092120 RepID=UPI002ADF5074|nr:GPW/gp25 family protein [Aquicoccus sp. G2-2]MEA1114687.1 GPW/gp25 family protein [Aquicoccus sp. G2-2]
MMAEQSLSDISRSEAVQPSLWDRLVDDLPGIHAETEGLANELAKALGSAEEVEKLIQGGARAIEARTDLDDDIRKQAHRLLRLSAQYHRLEERGVIVTANVLREAVRRDIEMLFNIERFEASLLLTPREQSSHISPAALLAPFPEVRSSVINYGVPSFSGRKGSDFDKDDLARELRDVLRIFEPRLKPETIRVAVKIDPKTGMRIEIDGVLMLSPVPERLRLSTTVDLENGKASTRLEDV